MLRWSFYSSGLLKSGSLKRVGGSDSADSMLRFRFERVGDGTKRYRKMKWRQWAHLDFMGRKRDMAWRSRSGEMRHRGGKMEETMLVGLTWIFLGQKIKIKPTRLIQLLRSVTGKWSGSNELNLTLWEESVTWRGVVGRGRCGTGEKKGRRRW
jgi:hypothetical protein